MSFIKFALVLDKPSQTFNKGTNVLYLGDFELCNAGDRSARIYVGDSNGDVIEIDDILDEEFEKFKKKIIKVSSSHPETDLKPQLLYLISNKNDGKYNNESILDMYNKFRNELDKKPYCMETKVLGVEHKLFPFIFDKAIFGVIKGSDIQNLMDISVDYTNQILNSENQIFTTMGNLVEKTTKGISEIYSDLVDYFNKINDCITRLLSCIVIYDDVLDKYNKFLSSRADELRVVVQTDLENFGDPNHLSTSNFSIMNFIIDQDTSIGWESAPFIDVIVGIYESGTESLLSVASFRIDKKLKYVTNFYGDPIYIQPSRQVINRHGTYKLPMYCKNRLKYKIISNCLFHLNCQTIISTPPTAVVKSNEFNNISDFVDLNDLTVISSSGIPCYLNLYIDNKNGRMLEVRSLLDNSLVNKYRSDLLNPSETSLQVMMIKQNGIVGFFRLLETPDKPGGTHLIIRNSNMNKDYYLGYDEKFPLYNRVRFNCTAWDTKGNTGTDVVQFFDYSGRKIHEINKWLVFGTWATNVEYVIPEMKEIKRMAFHRHLDTHSGGGARLNVDIFSPKVGWKRIIKDAWYRTGDHWEWISIDTNIKPSPDELS